MRKKRQHVQIKRYLNFDSFCVRLLSVHPPALLFVQLKIFESSRKVFVERKGADQGYTAQDCTHFLAGAEQQLHEAWTNCRSSSSTQE